mgnify:CR=1 FL=1
MPKYYVPWDLFGCSSLFQSHVSTLIYVTVFLFISPISIFYFQVTMNPTNSTNPFLSSVKTDKSSVTIPKQKPKMMIANHGPTINGALKVQQMLEGKFVDGSDSMLHSALLPFKGVYFSCLPCYLVGIEKKYSGITYTQSHGRKCVNRPTFIAWLSKNTEFHHLIPQCIVIDEFVRAEATPQAKEDQSFSVSHLNHLQTSFNSKVSELKAAADLLAEYTKKATVSSPVNDGDIADAIIATFVPVGNPLLGTNNVVNPPLGSNHLVNPPPGTTVRTKRKRKPSAKAKEADFHI